MLACVLLANPRAEIGITDDWSFALTALKVAQTGHIVYNGWALPMLGWQAYVAALFIKVFGFSFTVVRAENILMAMVTAFFVQRTLVRAGVNEWNASVGTLVLVLSRLYMSMAVVFMTDISGLFCFVICLYACLRALQARNSSTSIGWVCFAVFACAVGGTARQNVWILLETMIPGVLWLLRSQRKVLLAGAAALVAGNAFVYLALKWFQRQPYSYSLPLVGVPHSLLDVAHCVGWLVLIAFLFPFTLAPVLLMFVTEIDYRSRSSLVKAASVVALAGLVIAGLYKFRHHHFSGWITPFLQPDSGVATYIAAFLLLALEFLAIYGLLTTIFSKPAPLPSTPQLSNVTWRQLLTLLVPFTLAYFVMLLPKLVAGIMFDKYVFPVLMVPIFPLARLYQERVRWHLPVAAFLLTLVAGAYGTAFLHDEFSFYRARLAAIDKLRAAGVDDGAIDGVFEFVAWTEASRWGYINTPGTPGIQVPADAYKPGLPLFPHLKPEYFVGPGPGLYPDSGGFGPVGYTTWLSSPSMIYIYKVPPRYVPEY